MNMSAHFQAAQRHDPDDTDSDEFPEPTGAGWRAQLFPQGPGESMEDDLIDDEELEDGYALGKCFLVQVTLCNTFTCFHARQIVPIGSRVLLS